MFNGCVIVRTGQGRKAALALVGLIVGAVLSFFASAFPHLDHSTIGVIFDLLGIAAALGCFFFACRSIRCPACRTQWVWDAVRRQSSTRWLSALLEARACPACGYPDVTSDASPPNFRWSGP